MRKLKSVLGALAPTLGAAVGGPLGGQAGAIISKVLGVPNNPKSIETAMNNITSERMVELKKAEKDFELQMKQLEVDIYKLETEDIQDAREKFSNDWTPKFLGILSVLGFFDLLNFSTRSFTSPAKPRTGPLSSLVIRLTIKS